MRTFCQLLLLGTVLGVALPLWANEGAASGEGAPLTVTESVVTSQMDWKSGNLILDLSAPIPREEAIAPITRHRVETALRDQLPDALATQLMKITLDSAQTLMQKAEQTPQLYKNLSGLAEALHFEYSKVNQDYTSLTLRFTLPVWQNVLPLFIPEGEANEIDAPLQWQSTRDYSGLVIYARGLLPLGGTSSDATFTPALFPRLLDQNQEVLLDLARVQPSYLQKWGMVAYSYGFNETNVRDRIGYDPLRVVAWAVYGRNTCDLVLSQQDVGRLVGSPANRQLLSEGRVMIILDPPPISHSKGESHP